MNKCSILAAVLALLVGCSGEQGQSSENDGSEKFLGLWQCIEKPDAAIKIERSPDGLLLTNTWKFANAVHGKGKMQDGVIFVEWGGHISKVAMADDGTIAAMEGYYHFGRCKIGSPYKEI